MLLDTIHGLIERRILLNYRIRPDALHAVLPSGFRPILKDGWGIAGICMIRFKAIRPRGVPAILGINSENAAHRIAVEWTQDGVVKEGVFIPRRDTNSRWNATLGGRIFPGIFDLSRFESAQQEDRHRLTVRRKDGNSQFEFDGSVAPIWSKNSLFKDLKDASEFFKRGAVGYSATHDPSRFQGMELRTLNWDIKPVAVLTKHSALWEDRNLFPVGTSEFDSAMIMQNIDHEWRSRPDLYLGPDGQLSTGR